MPARNRDIRQRCVDIVQPCIFRDKDAILPALGDIGLTETVVVVVSADEHGASVVADRVLDQLEASSLKANCAFTISSVELKPPSTDGEEPVEKFVKEVADSITEMSMVEIAANSILHKLNATAGGGR